MPLPLPALPIGSIWEVGNYQPEWQWEINLYKVGDRFLIEQWPSQTTQHEPDLYADIIHIDGRRDYLPIHWITKICMLIQ